MKATLRLAVAACCIWNLVSNATFAQQAATPQHAPQVHGILASGDELKADLKFLVELAGPSGVKAWKPLNETLDTFLSGIDLKRPILVEVLLSGSGSEYRSYFPLPTNDAQGKLFISNLDLSGIKGKRLATGFSQLSGAFSGFLRVIHGHAVIAEKRDSLPLNLANPATTFAGLVAKKFDVGLMVRNDKQAAADQDARRKDFQKVRENLLAGLKQKSEESSEDYQIRRGGLEHNLSELERFLAESAELYLGWTTDAPSKNAKLDFELKAIKDSSLEESAKQMGKAPGTFASVPRSPDAVLSGRINFPLDNMRKNAALGWVPLARKSAEQRADAAESKTPEQKAALKKAANLWFDMLDAGISAGVVDGMIEVSQAAGQKNNLVFGIKAPDGNALKGIVELIPQIRSNLKVQMDAEKVGDVAIHKIEVPAAENEGDFELLFGKGAPVHVATAANAWWVAIGANSLDQLKAAIAAAGKNEGVDAANFFTLYVKAGQWIETLDTRRTRLDAQDTGKKLTEAEAKAKKERDAHRKLAIEAFKQGKDTWETKLHGKDGHITGSTTFDEGILRFIGSAIAKFSNETLK